jgi:4-hydroxy-2-oxoheptanedioate aldolase
MPVRLNAEENFAQRMAVAERAQIGVWICSGNSTVAEICASSGVDWILIDAEHTPNDLQSILIQLQAVYGHPVTPMVRPPHGDPNLIKQYHVGSCENGVLFGSMMY